MTPNDISPEIRKQAPAILAEIKKARRILLHCHPSPDPDSVGSALAMKFVLEGMGKEATVIKGDSEMPRGYANFPGFSSITSKHFGEIDISSFDLFISLDSAAPIQISRYATPVFPLAVPTIVIDHHVSNTRYGSINLVDFSYPSLAQILFELFQEWKIALTPDIAKNLFVGIYTDTGAFKYEATTAGTIACAAELAKIAPDYKSLISDIENTNTPKFLTFEGLALARIETYLGGKLAISAVDVDTLAAYDIHEADVRVSEVASFMRTVPEWHIVISIAQVNSEKIRVSSRTLDSNKYDLSQLMTAIGGGGHKAAAAAIVTGMKLQDVKDVLVAKAKELYTL